MDTVENWLKSSNLVFNKIAKCFWRFLKICQLMDIAQNCNCLVTKTKYGIPSISVLGGYIHSWLSLFCFSQDNENHSKPKKDRHPKSNFLWSGKAVSNGSLSRSVARRDKALRIFLWFSSTMGHKKVRRSWQKVPVCTSDALTPVTKHEIDASSKFTWEVASNDASLAVSHRSFLVESGWAMQWCGEYVMVKKRSKERIHSQLSKIWAQKWFGIDLYLYTYKFMYLYT